MPAKTRPRKRPPTSSHRALVERAIAFERGNLAFAAGHTEEHALGLWMRNAEHPQLWSLNQLYVDGPHPGLTAAQLTAELDRGLADARHRRVIITDDATGRAVADGMRDAGYSVGPVAVMVLDHEPPLPAAGVAREIDEAEMRALEEQLVLENTDIAEIDRPVIIEGHAHVRAAMGGRVRMFAGFCDGVAVCQTTLYAHDGVGQPEDVETQAVHRGKGIAAATVSLATHDALVSGCDLVFILCNVATGPFPLYAELGFRAAGRFWTFNRMSDAASPVPSAV